MYIWMGVLFDAIIKLITLIVVTDRVCSRGAFRGLLVEKEVCVSTHMCMCTYVCDSDS